MKKLVIVTNIPSPYRVDFFCYLQKNVKDYEIYIIYASKNEDNRIWEIDKQKIQNSYFLDSWTWKIPLREDVKYVHFSKGVTTLLKKLQPDIIVGSEYNPTILQVIRYCKKYGVPYVSWTDGTLHSERNINKIQKYLRHYVIRHAVAYIGSSTKSREAQVAYGAELEKCFISFLTVDLDKYVVESAERKENQLLFVGRLTEGKGVDLLFKALKGIETPFTLVLVGSGPEEKNLRRLAEELGISDKIEFLGYRQQQEVKWIYASSGIFVLPTRSDCFALVILEAMCAGLPIIYSKYADGGYDLVGEGENGYRIDPFDTLQFRERIQRLLENPVQAARMGEASLQKVEKFSFEEVSKGFMDAVRMASQERAEI